MAPKAHTVSLAIRVWKSKRWPKVGTALRLIVGGELCAEWRVVRLPKRGKPVVRRTA